MPSTKTTKDFRGLTIFELVTILTIIGLVVLWALSFKGGLQNKADDAVRRGRVSTLKENLNAYILQSDSFPSTEDFLDDEKRKDIFSRLLSEEGEDALHDPRDKDRLIDYIAEPEGCAPETEVPCTRVSVSFTLSGGEEFIRFSIKPGTELEALEELDGEESTIPESLTEEEE